MLLCLKALGGKAPISFSVDANNLWANKRMPEMLEIIRTCDELKRRDYFTEAACAELARPMAEHVLERAADGGWDLRPLQFGPPRVVDAAARRASHVDLPEPARRANRPGSASGPGPAWPLRAKENLVLADPGRGVPLQPDGTASADLVQSVETSARENARRRRRVLLSGREPRQIRLGLVPAHARICPSRSI